MKNMRPFMIVLIVLIASTNSFSQAAASDSTAAKKKWNYFFNLQTGSISRPGDPITFSTSTIHGVRWRKLSAGAGIGFDAYKEWTAMPLFGSVSWDLFGKKNIVFTQLNYGWAQAWKLNSESEYGFKRARGGETFSAMIGYRIASGDLRIALLAGYKFQRVEAYYEYFYNYYSYSSYANYPKSAEPGTSETNSRGMRRLAISLSVGWR